MDNKVTPLTDKRAQQAELTLLVGMEGVSEEERNKALKAFGVPDGEYERLVRKYRFLLKEFRTQKGTYKGEFDTPENKDLDAHEVEQGHKLLDLIIKNIAKRNGILMHRGNNDNKS